MKKIIKNLFVFVFLFMGIFSVKAYDESTVKINDGIIFPISVHSNNQSKITIYKTFGSDTINLDSVEVYQQYVAITENEYKTYKSKGKEIDTLVEKVRVAQQKYTNDKTDENYAAYEAEYNNLMAKRNALVASIKSFDDTKWVKLTLSETKDEYKKFNLNYSDSEYAIVWIKADDGVNKYYNYSSYSIKVESSGETNVEANTNISTETKVDKKVDTTTTVEKTITEDTTKEKNPKTGLEQYYGVAITVAVVSLITLVLSKNKKSFVK